MSPVTGDQSVGPRAMAYRKRERLVECIDCRWSSVIPEGLKVRIETRERKPPRVTTDPPFRAAQLHIEETGHRLSSRVRHVIY